MAENWYTEGSPAVTVLEGSYSAFGSWEGDHPSINSVVFEISVHLEILFALIVFCSFPASA
jgi:hypothetical protein